MNPEKPRKFVSISQIIGPDNAKWQGVLITIAVADDGTAWERWDEGNWCQVLPLPSIVDRPYPAQEPTR